MTQITIWHNPRCSKSRQTLALLEEAGAQVKIVKYLENSPDTEEITAVLKMLGISARDLLRKGEVEYKSLNLANQDLDEKKIIQAMVEHPKLIERPVVIKDNKAILGRPPENVLDLI